MRALGDFAPETSKGLVLLVADGKFARERTWHNIYYGSCRHDARHGRDFHSHPFSLRYLYAWYPPPPTPTSASSAHRRPEFCTESHPANV
ncbi:hypothetical protein LZ554_008409 [Drepanopeziza brunnea f. sp. 'monogermtubi']|nr:hypothetical protein LZ554_008409 [Drepanopeziza brunnea f. sp. 'monogermtubi']